MSSSLNQTQRRWEQRLGELIEKTSANLRKLQTSCDAELISCSATAIKESCNGPNMQETQPDGNFDKLGSLIDTFQNTNGEELLSFPPPASKGKSYPMTIPDARSTRTLMVCKQVEEAMVRRIENSMRKYLDHIVEGRITVKLGAALNEFNGMTRKIDDNDTFIIREKCQAISNSVLRLTKDVRTTKSELDALNTAKHEILLQQKEIDDRNASFTENLQRQIESIALANEKYQQKLIEHLKSTNVTLSCIPAIENDIKKLQETCINNQTQMTTLQKRLDLIAEEVLKIQNQSSLFKTEALSHMTHSLTPIIYKLKEEIHAVKNSVIEANTNEKSGITDPSQFEAVIEPIVAKVVSEMNKSLVAELGNCSVQHREKESKKLHVLFKDLKCNLGRRFYDFSKKITLLQQEEIISRMQQHKNDLEARYESFIEDHLIHNIRARLRECDAQQFKNQSTILPPQKDQCTPIINAIDIMEEWIKSIVSIALLPFTLKVIENNSHPPKQTSFLEDHHTREKSNFAIRSRDSEAEYVLLTGETCVWSTCGNSEKQSQTEHEDYCVSNSKNSPPADCDFQNLKDQLRKAVIEEACAAFDNRLQGHFVEFKQMMCEKVDMLFASYNTELTRVKVDAEAIYRFHRAIEKELDNKLSFFLQKWSEELRRIKQELTSLAARCDQGQMQQQCLQTAFNSVSDLALKCHERIDDVLHQITCLKQKDGQKDLKFLNGVDMKHCCQNRTDAFHRVIDEGDVSQQANQAENNGICKENLHRQIQLGLEHSAASVALDKMDMESKARLHSLSSEEYSKDEIKSKEQQLADLENLTLPHLLSIPLITSGNLSEKNDCIYYSPKIEGRNKDLQEESKDEGNSSLLHRISDCQHGDITKDRVSAADSLLNSFQNNYTQHSTESYNGTVKSKGEQYTSELSPSNESRKGMRSAAIVPATAGVRSFLIQHKSYNDDEDAAATSTTVDFATNLVNVESGKLGENQVDVDDTQQSFVYMDYQDHDLSISDEVSECIEVTGASDHSNECSEVQCYSFSFESSSPR